MKRNSVLPLFLVVGLFAQLLAGGKSGASAARRRPPQPKVHRELTAMQQESAGGNTYERDHRASGIVIDHGLVTISAVPSGDAERLLSDLQAVGLRNGAATPHFVSGRLPISSIDDATGLASLRYMSPARIVKRSVGGEGDRAMRSDVARTNLGVNGAGVTVGTLSDTFDCFGGAAADVAAGDLPSGIQVLSEGPCDLGIDEGRAMMQHIFDVAPGATQKFYTAFNGLADFAQGIKDLAAAGAKVINDDVGYLNEPFYQDGIVAQAIDQVTANGVSYFSAAGNSLDNAYESAFSGATKKSRVRHDFDPGPKVRTRQRITLLPGTTTIIDLQWADPFFTIGGQTPKTDLDLRIFSRKGKLLARGSDDNAVTGEPLEFAVVQNRSAKKSQKVDIEIELVSGPPPTLFKWIDFLGTVEEITTFDTGSPTVFGHPNATTAMALAAAGWDQTPAFGTDPALLEGFSSFGGTPVLIDTTGLTLAQPSLRDAPRFTGPDAVNTSFFGGDSLTDEDALPNFFGTSAAAPHAAGVAALGLQKVPGAKWFDVCNAIASTADEMETSGYDHKSGFGFIVADAALGALHVDSTGPCGTGP